MGNSIIEHQIDERWFKVHWKGYLRYWRLLPHRDLIPESLIAAGRERLPLPNEVYPISKSKS